MGKHMSRLDTVRAMIGRALVGILIAAFALALAAPTTVLACGTLGAGCCMPGNTCGSGLRCQGGICRSATTPDPPGPGGDSITLTNPLGGGVTDVGTFLERIMTMLRNIATPLAILMVLIGAFQMVVSAGDPAKFEAGKKTILYTAIGYAIIFVGWGITSLIQELLAP